MRPCVRGAHAARVETAASAAAPPDALRLLEGAVSWLAGEAKTQSGDMGRYGEIWAKTQSGQRPDTTRWYGCETSEAERRPHWSDTRTTQARRSAVGRIRTEVVDGGTSFSFDGFISQSIGSSSVPTPPPSRPRSTSPLRHIARRRRRRSPRPKPSPEAMPPPLPPPPPTATEPRRGRSPPISPYLPLSRAKTRKTGSSPVSN